MPITDNILTLHGGAMLLGEKKTHIAQNYLYLPFLLTAVQNYSFKKQVYNE